MSNNSQSFLDPLAVHQQMLCGQLHHFLASLPPILYGDVVRALEEPGKLFSQPPSEVDHSYPVTPAGIWSLLTLAIIEYIAPDINPLCASNVAIATECCICAIDLLDDIIDDDQTSIVQDLGTSRVVNISTALLMLAQRAILSLSSMGMSSVLVIQLLDVLQDEISVCTSGQHQDILAESKPIQEFTDEMCLEMDRQKAGSLMRLACALGTLCAMADDHVCRLFAELGELLGIANQLDNDCHDLYYLLQDGKAPLSSTEMKSVPKPIKTDLIRGKKTLPIVLAAKSDADFEMSLLSDRESNQTNALHKGILGTWGICLLYRERAHDCLQEIEEARQHPISPSLRFLLGFT